MMISIRGSNVITSRINGIFYIGDSDFAFSSVYFLAIYFKTLVVVPFNEIHVVSKKKKIIEYDGKGRYQYYSFFHGRTVIPKHVLDIEPGLLDLHDCDNLPFGVEISIKVQVTDSQKDISLKNREE